MTFKASFQGTPVHPGDPLTAEAWNEIVDALTAIETHLSTSGAATVKVQVSGANLQVATARVTATGANGVVHEAVRPVAPDTMHIFAGLPSGSYSIRAEAPGFDGTTVQLAVDAASPPPVQNVALTKRGGFMPLVFGQKLTDALPQLSALGIAVNQILDVSGESVPVVNPGPPFSAAFVIAQFPQPGVPVAPGEFAKLLLSASLTAEPSVEMPSLIGLTEAEARKALEAVGLKLGRTTTRRPPPTGGTRPPGGDPVIGGGDSPTDINPAPHA